MDGDRRLKLGLIGLGRLGVIRARILTSQQPRIELVAVCDTKPDADKWATENLPASIKFFSDPDELMKHGGVEAILISTATATHAPLIIKGLEYGLVSLTHAYKFLFGFKLKSRLRMSCARSLSPLM